MKRIQITIHKDGTQRVEVLNAVGTECVEFSRELERRLGKPEGERELKPEYHEASEPTERQWETGQ